MPRTDIKVPRRALGLFLAGALAAMGAAGARLSPTPSTPTTPPAREILDTLDYFLARDAPSLTGSHHLNQVIDEAAGTAYTVKGDASRFELHTWDDQSISQVIDHDPNRIYSLAPGTWLLRKMSVGESVYLSQLATITTYTRDCRAVATTGHAYTITLERRYRDYWTGSVYGARDTIAVVYQPAGGETERFYYAYRLGLVAWELYGVDGRLKHRTHFDTPAAPWFRPMPSAGCRALIAARLAARLAG